MNKSTFISNNSPDLSNTNTELNIWLQLVLWLESQYFQHETGAIL